MLKAFLTRINFVFLCCLFWLAISPLLSVAQVMSRPESPGLYIGLQAVNYRYAFVYKDGVGTELALNPVHMAVGYALSPRLAVQLGLAVGWSKYESTSSGTNLSGQAMRGVTSDANRMQAIPILVRYTINRPEQRFQVDALFGPTFVHAWAKSDLVEYLDEQVTKQVQRSSEGWNTLLTGGLGGRYVIRDHLQLTADVLLNRNSRSYRQTATINRNESRLTPSIGVGVQYRFRSR
jgi:hypothetical protein